MARYDLPSADMADLGAGAPSADLFFQLGMQSSIGRYGGVDLIAAHKWFNIAAMKGNREARAYRQEISREMSKDDIGRAQRRAREWLSRH